MRTLRFLLPALLLAACQREPAPAAVASVIPASQGGEDPPDTGRSRDGEVAGAAPQTTGTRTLLDAAAPSAAPPGQVVRGYVDAVLRRDSDAIDHFWQLPTRGSRPADDAALHALQAVRTLRVTAGTPVARDHQQPSHLLEVPVRIHAVTAHGRFTYRGWYRLVPSANGDAWLIHSAQLQPVLE